MINKKKKKKLPTIEKLRERLDYEFNTYIRERDGKCILSGSTEKLQCSHYYDKRGSAFLRWDERNSNAMSASKHFLHHHGRSADYALWMFKTHGIEFMEELAEDSVKPLEMTREKYNELIQKWKDARRKLKEKQENLPPTSIV